MLDMMAHIERADWETGRKGGSLALLSLVIVNVWTMNGHPRNGRWDALCHLGSGVFTRKVKVTTKL